MPTVEVSLAPTGAFVLVTNHVLAGAQEHGHGMGQEFAGAAGLAGIVARLLLAG